MDGFIDYTAQRNSCTLLDCVSTYSTTCCILADAAFYGFGICRLCKTSPTSLTENANGICLHCEMGSPREDGFIDYTAQRNSCTLLDCVSTYSIMDCPRLISAASSLGLHCLAKITLPRFLRKESKIDGGVSVAVNMHSLIVSEIDQ